MARSVTGGCQCGAVRYEIAGKLARPYACHCRDCQKQSASAFSLSIIVARADLAIAGPLASFAKATDSGAVTTCHFCPACGSRLFHRSSRSADWVTLKAGTLDDTSALRPVSHLWVSRKQPWLRLDPDAVAYETQPDDLKAWRLSLFAD